MENFCHYCEIGSYSSYCICNKTNDICPLVRRCTNKMMWLPLKSMELCLHKKEELKLKEQEYKVRFEKKGKLFVEVADYVHEIKNPFDYTPDKVEMVCIDGTHYIKGYEPIIAPVTDETIKKVEYIHTDNKHGKKNKK